MHRPTTWLLACVVALVVAPSLLLIPGPRSVGAQEGTEPFPGVQARILAEGRQDQPGGRVLQPYEFTFEGPASLDGTGAAIPEQTVDRTFIQSEYPVVVQVLRGEFALDLQEGDTALIDPRGTPIPVLVRISDGLGPGYDVAIPERFVQDSNGQDCTTICAVPIDEPVRVEEGMTVFLPQGVACLVCSFDTNGAQLRVFALLDPGVDANQFEWYSGQGVNGPSAAEATPTARRWANPATHCRNP